MNTTPRSATWTWDFDSPVAKVWPVLADTARFNEAAGLPRYAIDERVQPDGSVRYFANARVGLMAVRWEEQPVNWVHEQWFEHRRDFQSGPLAILVARLEVTEATPTRCQVRYRVEAAPRTAFGRLMIATVFFDRVRRNFARLADSAREFARGDRSREFPYIAPGLDDGRRARARAMAVRIDETVHGHGLADRLAELVIEGQEVDLWTIRPLGLARRWQVPERHAIEACLEAVRQGLLRLRWDLLCPRCQVGKRSVAHLAELPHGAHCDTCNIDYDQDYSANVELAFQPAESVRHVDAGEYCLFGPMSTPHILVQVTLAPGEECAIELTPDPGTYRLRTLAPGPEATLEWGSADGRDATFPDLVLDASGSRMVRGRVPGRTRVHNASDRVQTVILEELAWRRDALTARRATALQAFRDLFIEEILRPGDDVAIDHIAILFTDLKGSTALYERIGDAAAYRLVREHFALLGAAVREHDGAVVKTIGDAVMAVFSNPPDALRCCIRIQRDFARFNRDSGEAPVVVKLGVHLGRCISVTLNGRLDYYGTAANRAARLESASEGGDIVLSPEFAADPEVAPVLAELPHREERLNLKGFAEEATIIRVPAEALGA